jgi:hypothetical protein
VYAPKAYVEVFEQEMEQKYGKQKNLKSNLLVAMMIFLRLFALERLT